MKILIIASSIREYREDPSPNMKGLTKILGDIYYTNTEPNQGYFWISGSYIQPGNNPFINFIPNRKFPLLSSSKPSLLLRLLRYSLIPSLKSKRNGLLEQIKYQYILKWINREKPDLVHFHDLTPISGDLITTLIKMNIPCVLTTHLYIGRQSDLKEYQRLQGLEKEFLQKKEWESLVITGVSSNIVKRIQEDYPHLPKKNFRTILNGTDFKCHMKSLDIRKRHNISKDKKIFLCIGGISERKNQVQVIRAVKAMDEEIKKKLAVIFIGDISNRDTISSDLLENETDDCPPFYFQPPVSISEMHQYYGQGDFVISASKNESFGLTFIEGFIYGLPSVTFNDLDAIEDLYNPQTMLLAKDRSDVSLSKAMLDALHKDWNSQTIKEYGKKYSSKAMIQGYQTLYRDLLQKA